jgi:uncharacterized protein (DUF697 family)
MAELLAAEQIVEIVRKVQAQLGTGATPSDIEKITEIEISKVLPLSSEEKIANTIVQTLGKWASVYQNIAAQPGGGAAQPGGDAGASQIKQPIVATPNEIQEADKTILAHSALAAAAGVVPFPLLDVAGIATIQGLMISKIYKIYYQDTKVGFSDNFAQNLLTVIIGGVGPELLFAGAIGSVLKLVPVVGILPGGGSVSFVGFGSTYAVGKIVSGQLSQGHSPFAFEASLKQPAVRAALKQAFTEILPEAKDAFRKMLAEMKESN